MKLGKDKPKTFVKPFLIVYFCFRVIQQIRHLKLKYILLVWTWPDIHLLQTCIRIPRTCKKEERKGE